MNKISFTCHIFAEMKDKDQIATIQKVMELMKHGKVWYEIPDTFCLETPVIVIVEK